MCLKITHLDLLLPVLDDKKSTPEIIGATALALGQIFVATCDGTITEALITTIMSQTVDMLKTPSGRFLALGLSLLYLGKQQEAEVLFFQRK